MLFAHESSLGFGQDVPNEEALRWWKKMTIKQKRGILMLDAEHAGRLSVNRLALALQSTLSADMVAAAGEERSPSFQPLSFRQARNICILLLNNPNLSGGIACIFLAVLGVPVDTSWHKSAGTFDYTQIPAYCQRFGKSETIARLAHRLTLWNRLLLTDLRIDHSVVESFVACAIRETEHRLSVHMIYSYWSLLSLILLIFDLGALTYSGCAILSPAHMFCKTPGFLLISLATLGSAGCWTGVQCCCCSCCTSIPNIFGQEAFWRLLQLSAFCLTWELSSRGHWISHVLKTQFAVALASPKVTLECRLQMEGVILPSVSGGSHRKACKRKMSIHMKTFASILLLAIAHACQILWRRSDSILLLLPLGIPTVEDPEIGAGIRSIQRAYLGLLSMVGRWVGKCRNRKTTAKRPRNKK